MTLKSYFRVGEADRLIGEDTSELPARAARIGGDLLPTKQDKEDESRLATCSWAVQSPFGIHSNGIRSEPWSTQHTRRRRLISEPQSFCLIAQLL